MKAKILRINITHPQLGQTFVFMPTLDSANLFVAQLFSRLPDSSVQMHVVFMPMSKNTLCATLTKLLQEIRDTGETVKSLKEDKFLKVEKEHKFPGGEVATGSQLHFLPSAWLIKRSPSPPTTPPQSDAPPTAQSTKD